MIKRHCDKYGMVEIDKIKRYIEKMNGSASSLSYYLDRLIARGKIIRINKVIFLKDGGV